MLITTAAMKNVQARGNIFGGIAKGTKEIVANSKYTTPNTKFAIMHTKYTICKFTLVFLDK